MRPEADYLTIRETSAQACLRRILQVAADFSTDARDGGDLSEVDSASKSLSDWLDYGGGIPEVTDEELALLKKLANDYESSIAPNQFSEGASPTEVAQRLRDIAEELASAREEEDA